MKEYNYNGMLLRKYETIGWEVYTITGGFGSDDPSNICYNPLRPAQVDRDWVPVHPLNNPTAFRVCKAIDADPAKFESFLTGEPQ